MFGRNKAVTEEPQQAPEPELVDPRARKGAPTPSRKEQEAARKRPLIPQDRNAAKIADREQRHQDQLKVRAAMNTGEERYLPLRDKGPQKRLVRDIVDSRTSFGEFMMFVLLAVVIISFALPYLAQSYVFVIFWALVAIVVVESIFLWRRIKGALLRKFGEVERGAVWYGITRNIQFRKLRLPKPQVKRGTKLDLS